MRARVLPYRLVFAQPVSVFSGLGAAGLVDRFVVRDARGLPTVPGSSLKGRLRHFAARVLPTCRALDLRRHAEGDPHCKDLARACTLCRLFGSPSLPARLSLGEARLGTQWEALIRELLEAGRNPVFHPDVETRAGVAISRLRRTALGDHLFFDQAVPAISFAGEAVLEQGITREEELFLVGVGALVDAVGARKAGGRGALDGGIRFGARAA